MMVAESIAERQTAILVTLLLVAAILGVTMVVLNFMRLLFDKDSDGIWAIAIDAKDLPLDPDSLLDHALMAKRICGFMYFTRIWPRENSQTPETHQLMYDDGLAFYRADEIKRASDDARRRWQRPGIFRSIPAIRQRLNTQLKSFTTVADFARSKKLVLYLVCLDDTEIQKQLSTKNPPGTVFDDTRGRTD